MLSPPPRSLVAFGAALSAAVAAALSTPSHAAAHETPQRVIVVYSDLDLSRPAGAARLSIRVTDAVNRICGEPVLRPLFEANQQRECAAGVRAAVNPRIAGLIDTARARAAEHIANRTLAQAAASPLPGR